MNTLTQAVDLSTARINYAMAGEAMPVTVFLSGHRTPLTNWSAVCSELVNHCTVLAWDRPGTGSSTRATVPQHGAAVAELLNELLAALHIVRPIIVVAHSLGGALRQSLRKVLS